MSTTYRTEKGSAPENSAKIKLLRAVQRPLLTAFWHLEQRIRRTEEKLVLASDISSTKNPKLINL